jgi:predicted RNA-binding Zn ribbon-like protein
MMKPIFRRKSIGTKVSEEEYARLEALAGGRALSEWVREVLLRELDGRQARPAEQTLLAEVIALRTIVANVVFALSGEGKVTSEQMQAFIDRADKTKAKRALDLLSQAGSEGRGKPKGGSEQSGEEGA